MKTISQEARAQKALQVMQLTSDGVSVSSACTQAGMSRSSFYQFQKDHPEVLQHLQNELLASSYESLLHILENRLLVLEKLIDNALNPTTTPGDRLAIYRTLEDQLIKLANDARLGQGIDLSANEVLNGPELIQGKSRFTAEEPFVWDVDTTKE